MIDVSLKALALMPIWYTVGLIAIGLWKYWREPDNGRASE